MYIVGLFLMFLTCIVTGKVSEYCFADDDDPYLYFGFRTSYHLTHGQFKPYNGCDLAQLYVVATEGTFYPEGGVATNMALLPGFRDLIVANHEKKLGELCDKDLNNLKNWKLNVNITNEYANYLSPQGETDMRELAKRLKAAFPTLFSPSFTRNMKNYEFTSDKNQLTTKCMLTFAEELLGTTSVKPKELPNMDMLLKPYENCPAWVSEQNTSNFQGETSKFYETSQIQNVIANVNRRLGFRKELSIDDITVMYEMCRFDKALNKDAISAWCSVFRKDDFVAFEYAEDLWFYYFTGPGRNINAKIGCPLMEDLLQHFRKLEGKGYSKEPKAIFYFVLLEALNPLLAALGFKNDRQPLLASDFKESEKRLWRTSLINPFATNSVAAFYKCSDKPNKVVFHLAERLVEYEGCNEGVCDWKYIRNTLGQRDEKCNMDFCNIGNVIPKKMSKLIPEPTSKSISRTISNFNIILFIFLLVGFNKTFI